MSSIDMWKQNNFNVSFFYYNKQNNFIYLKKIRKINKISIRQFFILNSINNIVYDIGFIQKVIFG